MRMAITGDSNSNLKIISFNMHGFNQGRQTVCDLIVSLYPDVFLLQEHWLTHAGLIKFNEFKTKYFTFGSSAMQNEVQQGMLSGRPYGGVMTMINNNLRSQTETIYCSDRFNIVRISNLLVINVYLPCRGSDDRLHDLL